MGLHMNPLLFEEQHLVRVVELNGGPAFSAPDICRILGLSNVPQVVSRLDEDEKGIISIDTPGGLQPMNVVTEPGVYRLLFTSRKPIAERMKRWLAHDVIPAIRRDGFYGTRQHEPAPTPAEQRPFPDWPMEELRTKKGVVDMYRLLYGVMAAQWVSPQMGFPPPPVELVEFGRQMSIFAFATTDGA